MIFIGEAAAEIVQYGKRTELCDFLTTDVRKAFDENKEEGE
jgi:hypothetical protein